MITIDAQGKKLGRISTEVAKALMGKHLPTFRRNTTTGIPVHLINIGKADITTAKLRAVEYRTYSGHPGGLKKESALHLKGRLGLEEIFRRTISGMLPDNKLKPLMMKQLHIEE